MIYVGTDPIMRAYVVTGYSLKEIKQKLEEGYTISDSGDLVEPERIEETEVTTTAAETTEPVASETSSAPSVKEPETTKKAGNPIPGSFYIALGQPALSKKAHPNTPYNFENFI